MRRGILFAILPLVLAIFIFHLSFFSSYSFNNSHNRSNASTLPRLLLISSLVDQSHVLSSSARDNILVLNYDAKQSTLKSLVEQVEDRLNGEKVQSIAIAAHDQGTAQFVLTSSEIVNLGSTLVNEEQREFWQELGTHILPGGRLDLLACNLAADLDGRLLISTIAELAAREVAASTDGTGGKDAGGNWVLETARINLEVEYFDKSGLIPFKELLATQVKKLAPMDMEREGKFSYSIAADGDYVVVGAPDNSPQGTRTGAAYLYSRNEGGTDYWGQVKRLTPATTSESAQFGYSVSISGDYLVVGASTSDGAASISGAAYVFYKDEGGSDKWGEQKKINASDGAIYDDFGSAVALSGDNLVVGARGDYVGPDRTGSAYVFNRNTGGADNWGYITKITASDADDSDRFGEDLYLDGTYLIAGTSANDDAGTSSGSAYIFAKDQGGVNNWGEVKKLTSSDADERNYFGASVSLDGDYAIVGAPGNDGVAENAGAAYIFYRNQGGTNNWGQLKKLVALDASDGDSFGSSVTIAGDIAAVGARWAVISSVAQAGAFYVFSRNEGGTNNWGQVRKKSRTNPHFDDGFPKPIVISGDKLFAGASTDHNNVIRAGSAFIFSQNSGGANSWGLIRRLLPHDSGIYDRFGYCVDISGDWAIVGAYKNDEMGMDSGTAYIYKRDGGGTDNWGQTQKLRANDAAPGDEYGLSVAIANEYAVVGSWRDDDDGTSSGSAYIYKLASESTGSWGRIIKLTASDAGAYDYFGHSVDIYGNTVDDYQVIVGAYGNDDGGSYAGSAYIYYRNHGGTENWGQVKKLVASDPAAYDYFGRAVAISGEYAVAGAYGDDDGGTTSGSVYTFHKEYGGVDNWGQVAKLTASDPNSYDYFGYALDVGSGTVLVGAYGNDDDGGSSGSVYLFSKGPGYTDWTQDMKITADDAAAGDYFGRSVKMFGQYIVVGAYLNDDAGDGSGSAYIFHRDHGGFGNWGQYEKLTTSDAAAGDYFGGSVAIEGQHVIAGAHGADFPDNLSGAAYIFNNPFNNIPTLTSVTPSSGMDSSQTFTAVYRDGDGASDLRYCYFKIANSSGATANCVYFRYRRATNKLDLRTDLGGAWRGGYVLGTSNILQNSNVSVDISAAAAVLSGNNLTLTLPLGFKAAYAGAHNIYMQAYDMAYGNSGVTNMGSFTVNAAPRNINLAPDTGSGGSQVFQGGYSDANGESDVRYLYMKVGDNASATANCAYFRYRHATGKLDLRSDTGGSWIGGYVIGSANILENSQVSVDMSAVGFFAGGTDLNLQLPMEFKPAFTGDKRVYMNAIDMSYDSAGWEHMGTYTVTETNFAPTNQSLSPDSGTGGWKTFDATYRDLNGADDIRYTYFKLADAIGDTANCIYIRYRNATNQLDLRTDGGGSWIAGGSIGVATTLENSQVRINMAHVTETSAGNDLTVRLSLVFKAAFNGAHNLYMYCSDAGGLNSGWENVGTFTVTATAPSPGEARVLPLAGEIKKGMRLHFNDFLGGVNDAVWFVNDERLRGNDPSYRFTRTGLYQIALSAKSFADELIISSNELFVDEKLVRAGDLVSWNGEAVPVRLNGRNTVGIRISDSGGEKARVVRFNTVFTPGVRIMFDYINARSYGFIEIREGATPEQWQWVLGRTLSGEERILASAAIEPSDNPAMLAIRTDPRSGTARIFLNHKSLFDTTKARFLGGDVALLKTYALRNCDIIITEREK